MSAMNEKDYYAILGVSRDADKKTIQKAFQQKARKLHPDVNKAPDAEERFKEVSEAYAVLSDEQKRARYDAMRSGSPYASAGSPAAGGYQGGYAGGYQGGFGGFPFGFPFDMGGFGGFGGSGSGRRNSAYNPEDGADVVIEVDLTREQARDGARRGVKYRRYEPCERCHGSGSVAADHSRTCPMCGGAGQIDVDMSFLFGGVARVQCPDCGGSGRVVADPCPDCGGSGRRQVVSEAVVEFPSGTHDGDVARVRGMGHAGTNGAAAGDLVARAKVSAERLEGRAYRGFGLIGLSLPFLAIAALLGTLSIFAIVCLVPLLVGAGLVIADDPWHRTSLWWRRGGIAVLNGAANSLLWAMLLVWIVSCSQSALTSPYRMM